MIAISKDLVLSIIRLLVGITFTLHGSQKLFGLFGGTGLAQFVQYTSSLGFPVLLGYLAALFEFIGGVLITFGIATEVGAILVIPLMVVAIFWVHLKNGYFIQDNGFEYTLNLLILAICLIIAGPGKGALWDPFTAWRM